MMYSVGRYCFIPAIRWIVRYDGLYRLRDGIFGILTFRWLACSPARVMTPLQGTAHKIRIFSAQLVKVASPGDQYDLSVLQNG